MRDDDVPLPPPLTPPDCDLRGLEWMPLYGHRLLTSDFDAHASDAVFRAALCLWWAAWNQVPAASLPDDAVTLCRLAGLGRDLKRWRAIAEATMQGFVRCADGRLYHRALAPIAAESWEHRRKERARRKRWKEKTASGDVPGHDSGDGAATSPRTADRTRHDTTAHDTTEEEWTALMPSAQAPPPGERRTANGLRRAQARDLALPGSMRAADDDGKRLKPQDRADRDMVRWLTTSGGMDGQRAWSLLMAARDAEDDGHEAAARELERISRKHRLGWFAGEAMAR